MYASKLIWPKDYATPFESKWSIFLRIILLNALKPKDAFQLISNGSCENEFIDLKTSSWIDFNKFSTALNMDEDILKSLFEIKSWESESNFHHKICTQCLKNGYHTSLFDLQFVDTCPWHNSKLIDCMSCYFSVVNSGFNQSEIVIEDISWARWSTPCSHIDVDDRCIASIFSMTSDTRSEVNAKCNALVQWLTKINLVEPELFMSLCLLNNRNKNNYNLLFSAAETIAGYCPWSSSKLRVPVKVISWNEPEDIYKDEKTYPGAIFERKFTKYDIVYKSISHYIYRAYVKPHKRCWNELNHYNLIQCQNLNSTKICKVSLAYAIWMVLNEGEFYLDQVSFCKKRRPSILSIIVLGNLSVLKALRSKSIDAYSGIIYALFFNILYELTLHNSFSIKCNLKNSCYVNCIPVFENIGRVSIAFPDFFR